MNAVDLILRKRDHGSLRPEEIRDLIDQYTKGNLPDYQMSAFLMAAFLNGMSTEEATALTESMLYSGDVLDLSDIPGIKVDKHSTGGVGDKVSLLLAPIVAACGVPVPMISGRGLGHTGGTLDKLESISGFTTELDIASYRDQLEDIGVVMIGQTAEIAPADKKIYALRDVTGTVEFIPFIAASIMSKKLAEGIDALVLDVKCGSGAFMKTEEDAGRLAETLVRNWRAIRKENGRVDDRDGITSGMRCRKLARNGRSHSLPARGRRTGPDGSNPHAGRRDAGDGRSGGNGRRRSSYVENIHSGWKCDG